MRIFSSKETFDILRPDDGRDIPDVYFDGKPGELLRQTKQTGQPYAILTYACGDKRPKKVVIEFRD